MLKTSLKFSDCGVHVLPSSAASWGAGCGLLPPGSSRGGVGAAEGAGSWGSWARRGTEQALNPPAQERQGSQQELLREQIAVSKGQSPAPPFPSSLHKECLINPLMP